MEISAILTESLKESLEITIIIFFMMILVEFLVLKYRTAVYDLLSKNKLTSYIISSFFGIIPGCVGTFAMDTAYMSGLLGFGGLTAVMIATSGDEAFVMLSMLFSGDLNFLTVLLLIGSLFVLGIFGGFFADFIKNKLNLKTCKKCKIQYHKEEEFRIKHFIREHIYTHIFKKHILKIFTWVFVAIFLISITGTFIDISKITGQNMLYVLIIATLVGLLPISGPNLFLLVMFSKGMVPFSVLLANSIVQDGHGLLPIIGFSVDDAIKIKIINFIYGLIIGLILFAAGL